jgi:hypothetical protein
MLGVADCYALPYSGRSKPIESFWRHIAEMDRRFQGAYLGNKPGARPEDCDPEKAVPLEAYRTVLDETLRDYHEEPHRGDAMNERSPLQVYEQLVKETRARKPTAAQLRLCMLIPETVRLDRNNRSVRIRATGNRYYSPSLTSLDPGLTYTARYDPEDSSKPIAIYLGQRFMCDAKLCGARGFRDKQAAKDAARARRQIKRSVKEKIEAMKQQSAAAVWGPKRTEENKPTEPTAQPLPTSNVLTLFSTKTELPKWSVPQEPKEDITPDELFRLVAKRLAGNGT